jgi:hypothetical protein
MVVEARRTTINVNDLANNNEKEDSFPSGAGSRKAMMMATIVMWTSPTTRTPLAYVSRSRFRFLIKFN